MLMDVEQWPSCYRCKKPVDRVERAPHGFDRSVTFTVYCHGAQEVVRLSDADLESATSIRVEWAFANVPVW